MVISAFATQQFFFEKLSFTLVIYKHYVKRGKNCVAC